LYVDEGSSDQVRARVSAASTAATSRLAYPEARAALARRQREGAFSKEALRGVVRDLDRDMGAFVVVEIVPDLARFAGELAERHALRGMDALHLACALEIGRLTGAKPGFLCFDDHLTAAAVAEGMDVEKAP
jgi:predicted nucleic acid-binding protein